MKIIALLLTLLLLVPIIACAGENNKENNYIYTEPEITDEYVETEITDSLPDNLDFGGAALSLLVRGEQPGSGTAYEFWADEEDGDIINDSVYRRNRAVEERLNLKLNVVPGPNWQDYARALTMIRASVLAGDQAYTVIAGFSSPIATLSVEGILADIYGIPYIDLSKPWWNQRLTDELTIAGKLNFAAGDANLSLIGSSYVIYVDEKLRQDYEVPNLYDVVFDGKWTLDYMGNLVKDIYKDLNGDGKRDEGDQYGAVWAIYGETDAFIPSSNIRLTSNDENGFPFLDMEYERMSTLVNKVYSFYYENSGVLMSPRNDQGVIDLFQKGQTLLAPGYIGFSYWYYREVDDFGIIPYPKYDENQDRYYTYIQGGMSLLCVPVNCDKTEMVGAFLEATASESYKNLTPSYFDMAMKIKFARDEISAKMLDIVRDGINIGFANIYNDTIGSPFSVMRELMNAKNKDFASWFAKNEQKISLAIEKFVEQMTNQ